MKYKQLTQRQRYAIYLLLGQGKKQNEIAETIDVSPSTISRELKRNSNKSGKYTWRHADELACERRERLPKNRNVKREIFAEAVNLLRNEQWSPKQISGYLKKQGKYISHEKIYQIIREDKAAGGDLYKCCRHKLKHRRRPVGGASAKNIPNRTSISQRPPEADGKRFGDFEMDLIIGKDGAGAIITMVERSVNYMMMRKLPAGKNAVEVAKTAVKMLAPFKGDVKTITTDNGSEFAAHEIITKALGVTVYFADPYASWQKGAIENMNMLIRQYIPKDTIFKELSDDYIKNVQHKINRRPREKLDFSTPTKEFFNALT